VHELTLAGLGDNTYVVRTTVDDKGKLPLQTSVLTVYSEGGEPWLRLVDMYDLGRYVQPSARTGTRNALHEARVSYLHPPIASGRPYQEW
jgi:hypothetical protein